MQQRVFETASTRFRYEGPVDKKSAKIRSNRATATTSSCEEGLPAAEPGSDVVRNQLGRSGGVNGSEGGCDADDGWSRGCERERVRHPFGGGRQDERRAFGSFGRDCGSGTRGVGVSSRTKPRADSTRQVPGAVVSNVCFVV